MKNTVVYYMFLVPGILFLALGVLLWGSRIPGMISAFTAGVVLLCFSRAARGEIRRERQKKEIVDDSEVSQRIWEHRQNLKKVG